MLHCRRFAPTLFSRGENNREDNIFPYADVPHRTRCIICGWLKIFEFVGVVLRKICSRLSCQIDQQNGNIRGADTGDPAGLADGHRADPGQLFLGFQPQAVDGVVV